MIPTLLRRVVPALVLLSGLVPCAVAQGTGWFTRSPSTTTLGPLVAERIGDRIYVIGGDSTWGGCFNCSIQANEIYDPLNDIWITGAPVPDANTWGAKSTVLDGRLYLLGGWPSGGANRVYDPALDTWSSISPPNTFDTYGHAAASADGLVYKFGGSGVVEAYDPQTDTWTPRASAPVLWDGRSAVTLDGRIYVVGDWSGLLGIYDPAADVWSLGTPAPRPVYWPAAEAIDDQLYVFGGYELSTGFVTNAVQVYDPLTDTWQMAPDMPTTRVSSAAASFGASAFVFGGFGADFNTAIAPGPNEELRVEPAICDELASGATFAVGSTPAQLATADLNADGILDAVAPNSASSDLSTLFGDGVGGFTAGPTLPVVGSPNAIAVGDLDNDGLQDVLTAMADALDCAGSTAQVFLNDGLGGFVSQPPISGIGPFPVDVALADLNGDGALDAVLANGSANDGTCPDESLTVLFGDGAGAFAAPLNLSLGTRPTGLVVDDWNEDGNPDVGYTDGPTGFFLWLAGDGLGGLTPTTSLFCGADPRDVVSGDWNRDGHVDVAVALGTSDLVAILSGDGAGTFSLTTEVVGTEPAALLVADLAASGTPDLVVVNRGSGDVVAMDGRGDGSFLICSAIPAAGTPVAIGRVDPDGDGDIDLAIVIDGSPGSLAALDNSVNPANVYAEVRFPDGAASFADQVLVYDPAFGGGAVPAPPFDDSSAALGAPDAARATGARTTSLGAGGRIGLEFTDNRLGNSGNSKRDLVIFESGTPTETLTVAARVGNVRTRELLLSLGETIDLDGYVALGEISPGDSSIDLDTLYPGLSAGRLHFDAVRLEDDAAKDASAGPSVGADVDAVGAVASFAPAPDLEVAAFISPVEGQTGQAYNLVFEIQNVGDTVATPLWTDRLWISSDGVLDAGDTELAALVAPNTLAPGTSYTRVAAFEFPSQGTYWFFAVADASNVVVEGLSEVNNVRRSAQPVIVEPLPRPDMTVELLAYPSSNVTSGAPVALQYRVTNSGLGDTTATKWFEGFYLTPNNADLTGAIAIGSAPNASFLAAGDFYQSDVLFDLPTDFTGEFYFAVQTDSGGAMAEESEANNVVFSAASVTVALEDQPDLVPSGLGTTFMTNSSGSFISVSWTDDNQGLGVTDTSGWVDRVYLSQDSSAAISLGDVLLGGLSPGVLLFGGQTTGLLSIDVLLPIDAQGAYWLKVSTDASDAVSELGFETNNIGVSGQIDVLLNTTPDLDPTSIALDGGATSAAVGHPVAVTWAVEDIGFAGWEVPFSWQDSIYLSGDALLDLGTDVLLGSFGQSASFDGVQWNGSDYTKTRTVLIPESTPVGIYHLIVQVDRGDTVFELDTDGGGDEGEDNNVEASVELTLGLIPIDLTAAAGTTTTSPPRSGAAGQQIQLGWTVSNAGTADTFGSVWFDRVYLSLDDVLDGSDSHVATRKHAGALGRTQFYEAEKTAAVPFVPGGAYELLYVTDVFDDEFEPGAEGNNVASSDFMVTGDASDLVVSQVNAPDAIVAGETLVVDWTVGNQGVLETNSLSWFDTVYLSPDDTLDGGDTYLGSVSHTDALSVGSSRQRIGSFEIPIHFSGLWYVIVVTDSSNAVFETDETNNTAFDRMQVDIGAAPAANLVASNVMAPLAATSGQPIIVTWDVTNTGEGSTNVSGWADSVFLSQDGVFDPGVDRYVGYFSHPGFLDVGEMRSVSHTITIPPGVSGKHFAFVQTNSNGAVFESGLGGDNMAGSVTFTEITLPPPADLRITDVTADPSAEVGGALSIMWTTLNEGANAVSGVWRDSFYLSADGELDGADELLGQFTNNAGSLAVAESKSQSVMVPVPGILPGTFTVLGRSDVQNQINETDEGDNVTASASPTALTIPQLSTTDQDTRDLNALAPLYYELLAPAPNETIRVTLAHSEPGAWTELYIREGDMPSPGLFDHGFDEPGANVQEVLIPSTTGNPYYVLARATANVGPNQPATITTEVVPFELTSIEPIVAGTAVVTFELAGSQMDDLSTVRLIYTGDGSEFAAFELATIDASQALAAFDLLAAPQGTYDVIAESSVLEVSQLLGSVTLEAAAPLALGAAVSISPNIRNGRTGAAEVVISNAGNVNVPRGLVTIGTGANAGSSGASEEVTLSATALAPSAFERGSVGDTLTLFVEDLGPSQEVTVSLDVAVGIDYAPEFVPLAFSGVPRDEALHQTRFELVVAEELRLAVLADQSGGSELLALAGMKAAWRDAVLAGLPMDLSSILLPTTVPATGRGLADRIATAATSGLPAGNDVPTSVIEAVAPEVSCAVFTNTAFDCFDLGVGFCDGGLSQGSVVLCEGATPATGETCAASPLSDDPNEKGGPVGFGPNNEYSSDGDIPYRIYFENQEDAGAPAAAVIITDELEATFDLTSFRVGDIQIGDLTIEVPEGQISYQEQLDFTAEFGLLLNVTVAIDAATREALWVLQGIDPLTNEPPLSTDVGFLPPNNDDGDGEGYVEFTIRANDLGPLVTTTAAKNDADIEFDTNPPIVTNTFELQLDTEDPSSSLTATLGENLRIDLSWSGADSVDGSGVRDFAIWVSVDDGPYTVLFAGLTTDTAVFRAEPAHTYALYSAATDNAGRVEDAPEQPDVVITTPPLRPRSPLTGPGGG